MPIDDLIQRLRDIAQQRYARQVAPFIIEKEKLTEWIAADELARLKRHIETYPEDLDAAVRKAERQRCIMIVEEVGWGPCAPTEADYNRGLNSGAVQMKQAILEALER